MSAEGKYLEGLDGQSERDYYEAPVVSATLNRPFFVIIDDLPSDEPLPAEHREKILAWYRDAVEVADVDR